MKNYKNKNWLYQKYMVEQLTSLEIAELQNCTPPAIRYWLKKHNIKCQNTTGKLRKKITKKVLEQLYIKEHKTINEVANELKVSTITVQRYMRRFQIKSRKVFDYPSFIEGHKKTCAKITGKPLSYETRVKISKSKTHGEWNGLRIEESIFKKHRNKPEYKKWRQSLFKRDNFTCQECSKKGLYLELHHIIPLRDYEKGIMQDSNVISLCKKCHGKTKNREYEFVNRYHSIVRSS